MQQEQKKKRGKKKWAALYFSLNYIAWEKKGREAGVGVRVERKIFHSLETVGRWSWASPLHGLSRASEKAGGQGRGVQQEEHQGHMDMVSDDPGII